MELIKQFHKNQSNQLDKPGVVVITVQCEEFHWEWFTDEGVTDEKLLELKNIINEWWTDNERVVTDA